MTQKVIVSIIIPVYNVSAYIENCLNSVISQLYDKIECVIVNDATTDDSILICKRMITDYKGPICFSILHHEKNRGLSAARNTGMNAATGDYIFFLDSDDEITPDCIEKLIAPALNDPTIEMVIGNYASLPKDNSVTPSEKSIMKDIASSREVRNCYFNKQGFNGYAWNKLIRRDFLTKNLLYFKEGQLWEDYLWTFYVLKYLHHLYMISDITYKYHKRPHSITATANRKIFAYHMGMSYVEISNNFTVCDRKREAKHYVKGFCYCYIEYPGNQLFHQASRRFFKVLSNELCIKEFLLLFTTICMSKFKLGRRLLKYAATKMV